MAKFSDGSTAAPSSSVEKPETTEASLERVLNLVDDRVSPSLGALHVGFVQTVSGPSATVQLLGAEHDISAIIADHVDPRLVQDAVTRKSLALLQRGEGQ